MDIWAYYLTSYQEKKRKHHNNIAAAIIIVIIIIICIVVFFLIKKRGLSFSINNSENSCKNYQNLKDIIARNKASDDRAQFDEYNQIEAKNRDKIYYSDEIDPIITGRLYREEDNRRPIYTQRTAYGAPVWETQNISKYGKVGYFAPRGLHEYNSASYHDDVGVAPYIWRDGRLSNQNYDESVASIQSYDPNLYNNISKGEYNVYQTQKNINSITKEINYADDGIPQNWNLPSTPIIDYNMTGDIAHSNYGGDYYSPDGPVPFTADGIATMFTPDHEPNIN